MNKLGKLYLLPVPISEENGLAQIPEYNINIIRGLVHFIVEDAKTARRFLKTFGYNPIEKAQLMLLNEHSKNENIDEFFTQLLAGENVGLMSDAGCPGIADPGANVVRFAYQKNIQVIPLVGPSSIVLSIMASGFNSQNFAFVGYLPIDKAQKIKRIKDLEQIALKTKQAQFFMETPYRNEQLFELLITSLSAQTMLFVGSDILSENQFLKSNKVIDWKKQTKPNLSKIPAIFGIYSE